LLPTLKHWRCGGILCSVCLVPLLIKDTKANFFLLLVVIRLPKLNLISEQKAENIFVARYIANAMLAVASRLLVLDFFYVYVRRYAVSAKFYF
jgi:hypothetical protein